MSALVRHLLLGLVRLLVGAHARWQGCAPEPRPRIYFANHASHLDTLVIMAALPTALRQKTHPVAAMDYWGRNALTTFVARNCLGAVLVDRAPKASVDPLASLAEVLTAGQSLVIFPEGTRGGEGIGTFKAGLHHLARRFAHVELVPVYLDNPRRAMPKGAALLVPLICTVRFGAPLALGADEAKPAFLQRARNSLLALAQGKPIIEDKP